MGSDDICSIVSICNVVTKTKNNVNHKTSCKVEHKSFCLSLICIYRPNNVSTYTQPVTRPVKYLFARRDSYMSKYKHHRFVWTWITLVFLLLKYFLWKILLIKEKFKQIDTYWHQRSINVVLPSIVIKPTIYMLLFLQNQQRACWLVIYPYNKHAVINFYLKKINGNLFIKNVKKWDYTTSPAPKETTVSVIKSYSR